MNILKVGLECAHRIVAVSRGYAWECQTPEGGWGLNKILETENWKLRGIVNGIDYNEWSPERDIFLQTDGYANYSLDTLHAGKAQCKVRVHAWLCRAACARLQGGCGNTAGTQPEGTEHIFGGGWGRHW
eukprot:366097-Chlamydomonas_euryale.AAC.18